MFFRVTRSKGNSYLQALHSYRDEKGVPRHKVIASIANVTKCSDEEINRLIHSFLRALKVDSFVHKDQLEAGQAYDYGDVLPVVALWEKLSLSEIIAASVSERVSIDVAKAALVLVANKVVDPESKLGAYRWFGHSVFAKASAFQDDFPGQGELLLHTLYRSLDYLSRAQRAIENKLYWHLESYGSGSQLVFYDVTSSYFEGSEAELAAYGYSRDHRPDRPQVVIGLLTNAEGIPFAHYVFEGNRIDKATVPGVLKDLKQRFGLQRCVFVGDRGMVSNVNLEKIRHYGFDYIVGLRRRQSRLIKALLPLVAEEPEAELLEFRADEALPSEVRSVFEPGTRIIVALNREVQRATREHREARLAEFERFLQNRPLEGDLKTVSATQKAVLEFLGTKHLKRFFDPELQAENGHYRLVIKRRDDRLREEELLDGRFFLQTEVAGNDLQAEKVVDAYKGLQQVERAFRVLKDTIELRPIYVRKASRIRGHIMVCFLAYLMETLLDRLVREINPEMSWQLLKTELARVKLVPIRWSGISSKKKHEILVATSFSATARELYKRLGIRNARNPESLGLVGPKRSYNSSKQLSLFPEFSIT